MKNHSLFITSVAINPMETVGEKRSRICETENRLAFEKKKKNAFFFQARDMIVVERLRTMISNLIKPSFFRASRFRKT